MITLLYHLQALKWFIPSVVMLGTAPSFFLVWMGLRAATVVLPQRVFRIGDDAAYGLYQRLVLFFYENYNGLEVNGSLLVLPGQRCVKCSVGCSM